MKWVWHKGIPYKLSGSVIRKGEKLNFKAMKRNGSTFDISKIKGYKIISAFPDINTPVCNIQTQRMDKLAKTYPSITFISISIDQIDALNKWCSLRKITGNSYILSDYQDGEFIMKTKLLIKKRGVTARGFFILDDKNNIIDMYINRKLNGKPKWKLLQKHIERIILSKVMAEDRRLAKKK